MHLQNKSYLTYRAPSPKMILFECSKDAIKYTSSKINDIYENSHSVIERFIVF